MSRQLPRRIDQALAEFEARPEHVFARQVLMPVEQQPRSMPSFCRWQGGYRWFQAPNVVDLSKVRALRDEGRIRGAETPET